MGESSHSDPQEGVIQYQLNHVTDHHIDCPQFAELNRWRSYFFRLGLIGQDPNRYGGLGYGNISHRAQRQQFVISGTQTGHLPLLCREHYVLVEAADVTRNTLQARGPIKPSSEALTHAALYAAHDDIQCVIHVHSPLLWQRAEALGMALTPPEVTYGTPAMAEVVRTMVQARVKACQRPEGVIAMMGHEDGVIAYGADVDRAGAWVLQSMMAAHDLDEHYYTGRVPA